MTDAEIAELRKLDAAATPAGRPTWRAIKIGDRVTLPALFADNAKIAGAARDALPRLLDDVERAHALLRRIEWGGMTIDEWDVCPECRGTDPAEQSMGIPGPYGHKPGCELAAMIGAPTLPKSADRP